MIYESLINLVNHKSLNSPACQIVGYQIVQLPNCPVTKLSGYQIVRLLNCLVTK